MKITFLKKHDKYLPGDEVDLPDAQAKYLIRMQVAKETLNYEKFKRDVWPLASDETETEPEKVEMKPTKEKNDKAGPKKKPGKPKR